MKYQQYFAWLVVPSFGSLSITEARFCRCLYGQACWPSSQVFSSLSSQLSQPLLHPVPPASACYPSPLPSSPSGNCTDVQNNFSNGTWRSSIPGAMQNSNFELFIFPNRTISACYLNTTLNIPCQQGAIPPIGVDARSPSDIQAAVKFAAKYNLKVAVKNTGHDYLGRSTAKGGFLIWVHQMKNVTVDDAFVPVGGGDHIQAVTLGAGVQWAEAYAAAQVQGRLILGGLSAGGSVGAAGGWVLGGGHGALSASHGLGVDNVLQFTLVTSSGDHVTANAHTNPSLFWALRGGGGGTYGIVTSTTYRTHPSPAFSAVFVLANFSTPAIAQSITSAYVRLHPTLADQGWGGYSSMDNTNLQFFYISPNITTAQANATFTPFFDVLHNATAGTAQTFIVPYASFYPFYQQFFTNATGQVGNNVEIASRLLSRDMALNHADDVAKTMLSLGGVGLNFVAGGAVSRVNPDSTGLNPSWRKALAEVYVTESWADGSSVDAIQQARQRLKDNTRILDKITTDSGSYLNEGSLYEVDFKKSFFGSHYQKLKEIKNSVDPKGLFVVASGVGSDDWDADLNCHL